MAKKGGSTYHNRKQSADDGGTVYRIKRRRERGAETWRSDDEDGSLAQHRKGAHSRRQLRQRATVETSWLTGVVLSQSSGFYRVRTAAGKNYFCKLRGLLKKALKGEHQPVVVGDRVRFSVDPGQSEQGGEPQGVVEAVDPRDGVFSRLAAHKKTRIEQVLAANVDQVLAIIALADPLGRPALVDRYLLAAYVGGPLDLILVLNKADLALARVAEFECYFQLASQVIVTSVVDGRGLPELRAAISGRTSLLAGPSGVGKSSLLNALLPGFNLQVGLVSAATSKGRHTTCQTVMIPFGDDSYLIDSPGTREFAVYDFAHQDLEPVFPEIFELASDCRFSNCDHRQSSGCAVLAALEQGTLSRDRYQSYLKLAGESFEMHNPYG